VSKVAFAAMKAFTPQGFTASQTPPQDKTDPLTQQLLSCIEDIVIFSDLSAYFRSDGEEVKDTWKIPDSQTVLFEAPETPVPKDKDIIVAPVERSIALQPKHVATLSGVFLQNCIVALSVVAAILIL